MAEDSRAIVTEVDDAIAVIRFNRPHERNPLSLQTLHDLQTTLLDVTLRTDVSAIIFTGTDDVFASGANIRELSQLDATSARNFSSLGQRVFQWIADARQITIAAVNGYCMGGALDLALACDVRVASTNAVFAHPGARLGIITGWGGTQRLPLVIGRTRALELFATARRIDSTEALSTGLVTAVGDPVMECARATAAQVLHRNPSDITPKIFL
ncbi:MAG TPA: enoyl-CoA hydratase/isomerase family protein [Pyrinomonadaceae bacterium]|nr:enoyl-CoA hydratase/isomerase family protein [Pyrinomonadaceae bacterium]